MQKNNLRKLAFSFLLVLISTSGARGESEKAASLKISYNPHVPTQIKRLAGIKQPTRNTRFYGNIVVGGQKLAVHFYNLTPLKKLDAYLATQKSQFDVFIETSKKHRAVFERIQSIPVTYKRWPNGKLTVQMDLLWLDATLKIKPIIKLRWENSVSSGGRTGDDILFIFPKGLKGSALIQTFAFDYLEGPVGALSNDFSKADKKGWLSIFQEYIGNTGIDYTGWKWNGSRFAKAQEMHVDHDTPKRYIWNGDELVDKYKIPDDKESN